MPKTMRAAAIDQYGGPEVLALHELPILEVDAKELLIAVYTAGVGGWDADIRDGRDGWNPCGRIRFPFVLGTDGSGTIAHLGSRVRRFKVGGAKVLAVASGPDGVALTRRLGADAAVDGHSADFV